MKHIRPKLIARNIQIGIVVSRFNESITDKLLSGAEERLRELQIPSDQVTIVWVPGAIEIPLVAQRLANNPRYDAIICLGAVIQGQTDHYQYVCQQVSAGCSQVALSSKKPIIFGILTTQTEAQARERVGGKQGHAGRSAVNTALEMISVLDQLSDT